MIYLDSSALLKLLFEEPESAGLARWISERAATPAVSSELAQVEVMRASRRLNPAALPAARALLSQLDLIPLTGGVIDEAAALGEPLGEPLLRSLDALHLASALSLGADLSAFLAYDNRLVAAAQDLGLAPLRPGH